MSQLFEELKRRNVIRVGIAYAVAAWVILQVVDMVLDAVSAPDWVMQVFLLGTAVGFPLALLCAWAFEMTPEGVKREKDIDRSQSINTQTGRKLNFVITAVLVAAVAFLLVDKFVLRDEPASDAVTKKSVAVLPFVAMSNGPDDEYFADGLTEEILNSLTQLPELLVSARTSAFYFKGQDIPVGEIAEKLSVAHIVEGSVRRAGEQLRVTAQLIRASDGFHLWSDTYDRSATNSLIIQSDIAEKVALSLDVVLDDEQLASMRAIGLRDPEAFVAYQKGVELYNLAHGDENRLAMLERANVHFDQAIALAPELFAAYERHADYFTHVLVDRANADETNLTVADAATKLREDYENAIRHAPNEMESMSLAFDLAYLTGDWGRLPSMFEIIVRNSDCAKPGWLRAYAFPFGMASYSIPLLERRLECDPLGFSGWSDLIRAAIWAGDSARAIDIARTGLETLPHVQIKEALANALIASGQFGDAKRYINSEFRDERRIRNSRLQLSSARGDAEEVNRLLESFVDRIEDNDLAVIGATGNRELANQMARNLDARPYGFVRLSTAATMCMCGAPFDLEATPNFARRIAEAELPWPPASPIDWPLKDW